MEYSNIPFFDLIGRRLAWLSQRQDILADNVANSNTPGFKPKDLKEASFADLMRGSASDPKRPAATEGGHIGGAVRPSAFQVIEDTDTKQTLNGNSVDMESEMMKVSKTGIDYQFAMNLYRKQLGFIKTALGRSS
jgi:flagellar basal-body rod protein FlgB